MSALRNSWILSVHLKITKIADHVHMPCPVLEQNGPLKSFPTSHQTVKKTVIKQVTRRVYTLLLLCEKSLYDVFPERGDCDTGLGDFRGSRSLDLAFLTKMRTYS